MIVDIDGLLAPIRAQVGELNEAYVISQRRVLQAEHKAEGSRRMLEAVAAERDELMDANMQLQREVAELRLRLGGGLRVADDGQTVHAPRRGMAAATQWYQSRRNGR